MLKIRYFTSMEKLNPICVIMGAKMRQKRLSIPLTQEELARAIRINPSNYAAIERGERNVSAYMLARIALGLKSEVQDLMPSLAEIKRIFAK